MVKAFRKHNYSFRSHYKHLFDHAREVREEIRSLAQQIKTNPKEAASAVMHSQKAINQIKIIAIKLEHEAFIMQLKIYNILNKELDTIGRAQKNASLRQISTYLPMLKSQLRDQKRVKHNRPPKGTKTLRLINTDMGKMQMHQASDAKQEEKDMEHVLEAVKRHLARGEQDKSHILPLIDDFLHHYEEHMSLLHDIILETDVQEVHIQNIIKTWKTAKTSDLYKGMHKNLHLLHKEEIKMLRQFYRFEKRIVKKAA